MRSLVSTPAGLACPHCGSTSFDRKRSKKGLLAFGLLARKKLRCDVCKKKLKR